MLMLIKKNIKKVIHTLLRSMLAYMRVPHPKVHTMYIIRNGEFAVMAAITMAGNTCEIVPISSSQNNFLLCTQSCFQCSSIALYISFIPF